MIYFGESPKNIWAEEYISGGGLFINRDCIFYFDGGIFISGGGISVNGGGIFYFDGGIFINGGGIFINRDGIFSLAEACL